MRRREKLLVAGALWTAVALTACAGSKPAQRGAAAPQASHPEVDTGLETCAGCHGSTGQDFRARPESAGCRGCHPVQVSSVTRDGRTQGCFQCHPPHALRAQGKTSPHPPRPVQGS